MLAELRAHVLEDETVSGLVGARMYPTALPQNATFPAISYQLVSEIRTPTMLHPDTLPEARVQIDAWGKTFAQAHAVAEALRECLDGFRGQMDSPGIYVGGIFADTGRTFYESEPELHRVSRDYIIHYGE